MFYSKYTGPLKFSVDNFTGPTGRDISMNSKALAFVRSKTVSAIRSYLETGVFKKKVCAIKFMITASMG